MNYIKEINAFYDRQEQEPLSSSAVALWYALMHMNNKTRWKNTFTTPGPVLRNKAGLSESSFKRARTELIEHGYIEVSSQGRGKAPVYRMHSLVVDVEDSHVEAEEKTPGEEIFVTMSLSDHRGMERDLAQRGVQKSDERLDPFMKESFAEHIDLCGDDSKDFQMGRFDRDLPVHESMKEEVEGRTWNHMDQEADQLLTQLMPHQPDRLVNHQPDHHPNQGPTPLYKQDINKINIKQNKTNASAAEKTRAESFASDKIHSELKTPDAIRFYQENFGFASPFVAESLLDWVQDLGDELVIEAMKRALERGKTSWSYVKSILNSWYEKGIRTVEQAQAEQVAFENGRRQKQMERGGFSGGFGGKEEVIPDWFYEQKREREERERKVPKQKATLEDLEKVKREVFGEE